MTEKYEKALIALSEILVEKENALNWKDTQIELRNKQIDTLKTEIERLETSVMFQKKTKTEKELKE